MRYVLLNKPYGYVSQFTDLDGHAGLKALIDIPNIYPVGRLDHDSEGLLLLTDDGPMAHRLTDPRFKHPKTYWAQVDGIPTEAAMAELRRGVIVQGQRTLPAEIELLATEPDLPPRVPPIRYRANIPTSWMALTLHEGRNRQVRRMTAAVGFPTLRLVRVAIGPLRLDGLAPGEFRDITPAELTQVRKLIQKRQ